SGVKVHLRGHRKIFLIADHADHRPFGLFGKGRVGQRVHQADGFAGIEHEISSPEGNVLRILWQLDFCTEPAVGGRSLQCGTTFASGPSIAALEMAAQSFCSNLHYLQWWKRRHPDDDALYEQGDWQW